MYLPVKNRLRSTGTSAGSGAVSSHGHGRSPTGAHPAGAGEFARLVVLVGMASPLARPALPGRGNVPVKGERPRPRGGVRPRGAPTRRPARPAPGSCHTPGG